MTGDFLVQERPPFRTALRLVDVKTGQEIVWDGRESIPPAEYETEAAPGRIRIHPATAKNLLLDSARGGVAFGVWVNVAADPPTVVRSRFDLFAGGGVGETLPIAPASFRAVPVLSLPPNGSDRSDPWIAWIEGATLKLAHGADVKEILLPAPGGRIVAPIVPGAAVIWMDGSLHSAPGGARTSLSGPTPDWMMSHTRSSGRPEVSVIQSSAGRVSLVSGPWTGPLRPLKEWKGAFVAAGATLGSDDVVRGAVILGRDLVAWEIDKRGAFRESEKQRLPQVAKAVVRVSDCGVVAALLRDEEGTWSLFSRGVRRPLPAAVAQSVLPIEVAFLGKAEPVLICAVERLGFRVLRMDGSPL